MAAHFTQTKASRLLLALYRANALDAGRAVSLQALGLSEKQYEGTLQALYKQGYVLKGVPGCYYIHPEAYEAYRHSRKVQRTASIAFLGTALLLALVIVLFGSDYNGY